MISVESSAVIDRPVEDVFAVVSDQTNEPRWHTDVIEIRPSSASRRGLGSTWLVTVKFMGRNEYEVQVTGFEPNRLVEITTTSGPLRPTATYLLEPADSGTRFVRHVEIPTEGALRIMKPVMQKMAHQRNARFVQNLKELLEQ